MVGGVKTRQESNSIPTRDAWRGQTNLVHTRTQRPTELCLSVSGRGIGPQWPATGAGALGAADLGAA